MQMVRYTFLIIGVLLGGGIQTSIHGQDFSSEFNRFKASHQKEYDTFVEQIDQEFADFLKQNWRLYGLTSAAENKPKPKPNRFPVADTIAVKPQVLKAKPVPQKKLDISHGLIMPVNYKSRTFSKNVQKAEFAFFGEEVKVRYEPNLRVSKPEKINNETIAGFWEEVSKTDYMVSLDDLFHYNLKLGLNDYGYFQLVTRFCAAIAPTENVSTLLTWYLLNKSKYKARIGYNTEKVYLMIPSDARIYGTSYFDHEHTTFYVFDYDGEELYSYEEDYPHAYRLFDFAITKPLKLPSDLRFRGLTYHRGGVDYTFNISYNKNAIDFYKSMPQLDLKSYFNSQVAEETRQSIIDNLQPVVDSMDEVEAVQFLLHFVQKGFGYKIDEEQFGVEKVLFPEEILFYPFSDCEDRSVFFAYLVSTLIGNDVIGLDYPGHVATGVHFSREVPGDYYLFNEKKYIVCDPTYINAPVGMSMKDLTGVPAEIIVPPLNSGSQPILASLKKMLGISGTPSEPTVIEVKSGKIMAGNYAHEMIIQNESLEAKENTLFMASFDANNKLNWLQNIGKKPGDSLLGLKADGADNTYFLYATFEDKEKRLYLSKVNHMGVPIWSKAVPSISPVYNQANTQVTLFNVRGDRLAGKTYSESDYYSDEKLKIKHDKILVILPIDRSP